MNGPVVLLVPPAGGDSTTWGQYRDILAGSCHVIAHDRQTGSLGEQASRAARAIAQAGTGPAIVVGASAGATIALRLAVDNPELVRALHVHEPPFHAKKHPNLQAIRVMIATQRREKKGRTAEAAEGFARWAYRRTDGRSMYDEWPAAWRDVYRSDPAFVLADIRIATGESIRRRELARASMPALCTAGTLSSPAMRKLVRRLASRLPDGSYVEVPGASHSATFEQPQAMAELTLGLMKEPVPAAR